MPQAISKEDQDRAIAKLNGTGTLAAALVAAQAAMPKVEADATNPHYKSKFVSLDHLIAKTRPVLNKHGLAIVQSPSHIDGTPALSTTIYHSSGEHVTDVMPLILSGQDMQKLGAALTYARRYAWAAALGISEQEDDDGEAASRPARKPQEASGAAGSPQSGAEHRTDGKRAPEPATTWATWEKLMKELGVSDPNAWLAKAVAAFYSAPSLKDLTDKQRKEALAQANDVYMAIYGDGGDLEQLGVVDDARLTAAFSTGFGGVAL